jgi:hypothetical protein
MLSLKYVGPEEIRMPSDQQCGALEHKIHDVGNMVTKQLSPTGQLQKSPETYQNLQTLNSLQNQYKTQCPVLFCAKVNSAMTEIQNVMKDPRATNNPQVKQIYSEIKAEHDGHCKP